MASAFRDLVRPVTRRAAGRRPGNADTRGEIVQAATRVFAAKGYDGTSLRAVAREAGVDPALVHHYFEGKAGLFVAAMALPFDPRSVHEHAGSRAGPARGRASSRASSPCGTSPRARARRSPPVSAAMAASPSVADAMREFVRERVWQHQPGRAARARRPPTPAGRWWRPS